MSADDRFRDGVLAAAQYLEDFGHINTYDEWPLRLAIEELRLFAASGAEAVDPPLDPVRNRLLGLVPPGEADE